MKILDALRRLMKGDKKEDEMAIFAYEGELPYLNEHEIEWLNYILGNIVEYYAPRNGDGMSPSYYKDNKITIDLGNTIGTELEVRYLMNGKWYPVYRNEEGYKYYKGAWFSYVEDLYMRIIWDIEANCSDSEE